MSSNQEKNTNTTTSRFRDIREEEITEAQMAHLSKAYKELMNFGGYRTPQIMRNSINNIIFFILENEGCKEDIDSINNDFFNVKKLMDFFDQLGDLSLMVETTST